MKRYAWMSFLLLVVPFFSWGAGVLSVNSSLDKPLVVAVFPVLGPLPKGVDSFESLMAGNFQVTGLIAPTSKELPQSPKGNLKNQAEYLKKGVEYAVLTQTRRLAQGGYEAHVRLVDLLLGKEVAQFKRSFNSANYLLAINLLSNQVFEKITGVQGLFNSRVAYVTESKKGPKTYRILFSYLNGSGETEIIRSPDPILSLAFSPDGRELAYVSFESRIPTIYLHRLSSGTRKKLQLFKSNTFSPSYSPDGKHLAFSVARNGQTNVYTLEFKNNKIQKLTKSTKRYSIYTEPVYSQDAKRMLMTTDAYGGNPQLVQMNLDDRSIDRITKSGAYSAGGSYINHDEILMIRQGDDRVYSLYRYYVNLQRYDKLTLNTDVESFSLSPNQKYVIYTQTNDLTGSSVVRLMHLRTKRSALIAKNTPILSLREAVWSPILE